MTIEEAILEKVRALPPEKRREVLDLAEFLRARSVGSGARTALRGAVEGSGNLCERRRHRRSAP
jgi:hypothetical protein